MGKRVWLNTEVPKKPYGTLEEFIEWINNAEINEVGKLLERHGFEFEAQGS